MTDSNMSDRSFGELTENPDNVQDSEVQEETTETTETMEETPEVTERTVETESTEEPQLTEKGTKLDPNPQSAVHQQLANEKRIREQYEKVLSNPQMLSEYMKKQFPVVSEPTKADEAGVEVKEYKPEDFGTLDDVAKVVNSLQRGFSDKTKSYEDKINQLNNVVNTIATQARQQSIANTLKYETESVKNLPEFNPDSPDYVKGLEEKILNKFYELDYDQNTGFFRGEHSLTQMVNETIDNIKMGRQAGSLKAQTIVKNKAEGKVKVSPKVDVSSGNESLDPGDSIAQGIANKFGRH